MPGVGTVKATVWRARDVWKEKRCWLGQLKLLAGWHGTPGDKEMKSKTSHLSRMLYLSSIMQKMEWLMEPVAEEKLFQELDWGMLQKLLEALHTKTKNRD